MDLAAWLDEANEIASGRTLRFIPSAELRALVAVARAAENVYRCSEDVMEVVKAMATLRALVASRQPPTPERSA